MSGCTDTLVTDTEEDRCECIKDDGHLGSHVCSCSTRWR